MFFLCCVSRYLGLLLFRKLHLFRRKNHRNFKELAADVQTEITGNGQMQGFDWFDFYFKMSSLISTV